MHRWIYALLTGITVSSIPLAAQAEGISTHVLDISNGVGRGDVPVTLSVMEGDRWTVVGSALTEDNGRVESFGEDVAVKQGTYKLTFDTSGEFGTSDASDVSGEGESGIAAEADLEPFFSEINVVFNISAPEEDYHIPILVSPYGFRVSPYC